MGRRPTGTVEPLQGTIRLKFTTGGERRVETLRLAPTPANIRAAEKLLSRIQGAIAAGLYSRDDFFESDPGSSGDRFWAYAEKWLATKGGAKSTLDGYRGSVNFWKRALADEPLADILHSDIKAAVKAKSDQVSGKTVNNHLIVIRGIFEMAEQDGLIERDPTTKIKSEKHQAPPPDPFDRDEMEAILAHMQAQYPEPVWNYYETAFCTGLRPSEEIAAAWLNLDSRQKILRIDSANVRGDHKDTKTHTVRDIELSDRAMAAIKRQKTHTFMRGSDAPIFNNPVSGEPWADEQRQRRAYFHPTLRALGIRMRDAYNTRHTFATVALMNGVNPAWIARQLGHVDTSMLFRRYAKWIDRADKGVERGKMNAILSSNCPRGRDAL